MRTAVVYLSLLIHFTLNAEDKPELIDALAAQYRQFNLPMPTDNAKLVRIDTGWRTDGDVPIYTWGFLFSAAEGEAPPTFLVGTLTIREHQKYDLIEAPPKEVPGNLATEWSSTRLGGINIALPLALQMRQRGWNDAASQMLQRGLNTSAGHVRGSFAQRSTPNNPEAMLTSIAFVHYAEQLVQPDTDWTVIFAELKNLRDFPDERQQKAHQWLLAGVAATLNAQKAPAGSIDALIDQLATENPAAQREHTAAYQQLLKHGYDAVPSLAERLDDRRLTRQVRSGFNNFPSYPLSLELIVSDLIQEIAGQDFGRDWLQARKGQRLARAAVLEWYESVKDKEEENVVQQALPKGEWPANGALAILARKYPHRLLEVYKRLLKDRVKMQSWPVAEAIATSDLPREQKVAAFLEGTRHQKYAHRHAALLQLKELDKDAFHERLLDSIATMTGKTAGPLWKADEGALANVSMHASDNRVWEELLKLAKKSELGVRMEMLNPMNYSHVGAKNLNQRLTFLANFLDDTEVQTPGASDERFDGPHAGFTYERMSVQNLAAEKLGSLLKVPGRPDKKWTAEQWEKHRHAVKQALAERQIGTQFR